MHVAIIPDGNRRWARKNRLSAIQGHSRSASEKNITALFSEARRLDITYLTLWLFSTENWTRPEKEVDALFSLLRERISLFDKEDVRVRWLGRRDRVPADIKESLERLEEETAGRDGLSVQLCIDYGGRDELLRAAEAEGSFEESLDTAGLPDVDLIIRTSGERRLSGFLPWLGAYAELVFVDKHFPDFGPDDLAAAIEEYEGRQRRFGA